MKKIGIIGIAITLIVSLSGCVYSKVDEVQPQQISLSENLTESDTVKLSDNRIRANYYTLLGLARTWLAYNGVYVFYSSDLEGYANKYKNEVFTPEIEYLLYLDLADKYATEIFSKRGYFLESTIYQGKTLVSVLEDHLDYFRSFWEPSLPIDEIPLDSKWVWLAFEFDSFGAPVGVRPLNDYKKDVDYLVSNENQFSKICKICVDKHE
jgi:hypothetical protein